MTSFTPDKLTVSFVIVSRCPSSDLVQGKCTWLALYLSLCNGLLKLRLDEMQIRNEIPMPLCIAKCTIYFEYRIYLCQNLWLTSSMYIYVTYLYIVNEYFLFYEGRWMYKMYENECIKMSKYKFDVITYYLVSWIEAFQHFCTTCIIPFAVSPLSSSP